MDGDYWIHLFFLFLEIHSKKILLISTAVVCCINVDALHFLLLCLVVVGVVTKGGHIRSGILKISSVYASFLILAKMVFQTKLFPHTDDTLNCTSFKSFQREGFVFAPNAAWFGFETESLTAFHGYFAVLALATFFRATHMNLRMRSNEKDFNITDATVLFPEISREDADASILQMLKFLVNYGFFKFGIELCKITFAIVIIERHDMFGLVYGICLVITLLTPRNSAHTIWTLLGLIVALCAVYQYAMALGAFPSLCFEYPWPMRAELRRWLFVPYHNKRLETKFIIGDIVLLLLLRQQSIVFHIERKEPHYPAGSNFPVFSNFSDPEYQNPVPDHTNYLKPGVDHLKAVVLTSLHWGSLTVSFMAGSTRSDLLSLGYLVGAFCIIWQGTDLYLWPIPSITKRWNIFMIYAAVCMIFKSIMSDLSCIEEEGSSVRWRWALWVSTGSRCDGNSGLHWDLLAFCFYLFQKRFFESHYFLHQVNDTKATLILQSSGAALIEQLQHDQLEREKEERRKTLNKIKADMAIIKAFNERVLSPNGSGPLTHDHAIMAGDYFLFEDVQQMYRSTSRASKPVGRRRHTITFDEFIGSMRQHDRHSLAQSISSQIDTRNDIVINELKEKLETSQYSRGAEVFEVTTPSDGAKAENNLEPRARAKSVYVLQFIKEVLENALLDLIPILNKLSRDYRFVEWAMKEDKTKLKERRSSTGNANPSITLPDVVDFEKAENEEKEESIALRFLDAVWYALMANSELLCYLAVFLHQILVPSLISLPLPLMVLLWGALTTGRPSPTFWTTLIAYTEVIMVMKALFQNDVFPWSWSPNRQVRNIFYPPGVIGIENQGFAFPDICLLLMLFIHRKQLKNFGMWTDNRMSEARVSSVRFMDESSPSVHDSCSEHITPIRQFFQRFRAESQRLPVDVYTYSFLCEFLTFIIVFFGFSSFSSHAAAESGDRFYLAENEVPITYLVTLIIQFIVILVDRVLYLRKNIIGKLVFHITLVILSHVWLFVVLPFVTYRAFAKLAWPQVWYFFKFSSFLISAYQLRTGYPMRVQGHFLCKNYYYHNAIPFKILKMIPFFVPIRQTISWLCVKTSLTISEWYVLDTMTSVIFEARCNRRATADYPKERGQPVRKVSKWTNGIIVLGLLFLIIWSPLILFAIFNSVAEPAPPTYGFFTLRLNTFEALYTYKMKQDEISPLSDNEYQRMQGLGRHNPEMRLFLENYDYQDVSIFKLNPAARSTWTISPANLDQMISELLKQSGSMELQFAWEFQRQEKGEEGGNKASGDYSTQLGPVTQKELLNALQDKTTTVYINIHVPLYFEMKGETVNPVILAEGEGPFGYGRMTLSLQTRDGAMWWEVSDKCQGEAATFKRLQQPQQDCERIVIYVFSQKHVPGIFKFITAKGIIGIYASFVLLIWTVLRRATAGMYMEIKYQALPNVDLVQQLCKDLHLARESEELALEEDLFAKLLFLFRSPETMIRWTRFREDQLRPPAPSATEE